MQEERTLPIHLALLFIVLLFGAVILYARHVNNTRADHQTVTVLPTRFTTYVYGVNLEYPSEWQPTPGYNYDHYNGVDGFFGLSAAGDADTTLDQLVKNDTTHVLKPYGSKPITEALVIDKQPAVLIMPSSDQGADQKKQAELIVKYPRPVTISGKLYYYLILWADTDHIHDIARSIKFQ